MNRQQAKELLPIIQAFAEGKTIEVRYKSKYNPGEWIETTIPSFDNSHEYRIKPESKYRSFNDTEECWQEMLKHQPFGWLKDKEVDCYTVITRVLEDEGDIAQMEINGIPDWNLSGLFDCFTFADGTPFGIKEE